MLAVIESNPELIKFVSISLVVVIIGLILRLLRQTHVVVYILTGLLVGPHMLGMVSDTEIITSFGDLGLILLLFFIGMEISLEKLIANWKISVIGTVLQVLFSIGAVWFLGQFYGWATSRIVTMGFVLSLSSTAVVVKLLHDSGEINKPVGQNVLGVLLVQDILIVPMMIILSSFSGKATDMQEVILQLVGGVLVTGFVIFLLIMKEIKLPFHTNLENDHEIQIFFAFALCFGFSAITGFFGLSTALGAFVAGIFVSTAQSIKWVHDSLFSLKVIFVGLFFISVGMLIDVNFLFENIWVVASMVVLAFVVNNLINTLVMRSMRMTWGESVYAGALLSQIGEFSLVLGSLAFFNEIISDYGYQLIVITISLTLTFSPMWIGLVSLLSHRVKRQLSR